jgi:hypothetical protein
MKNIIYVLLVLFLAGCGGEENELNTDTPEGVIETRVGTGKIIPLAAGHKWIYEVRALDTTVNALRAFRVDTFHVVRDTTINNGRWFEIDGLDRDRGLGTNLPDGFWYARAGENPFLFAKYPAAIGDTFTSKIGRVEAKTTVVATDLKITTAAGDFFCYKYVQKIGPMEMTTHYYFAPGVGLIKMEIMDQSGKSVMAENRLIEIKRE